MSKTIGQRLIESLQQLNKSVKAGTVFEDFRVVRCVRNEDESITQTISNPKKKEKDTMNFFNGEFKLELTKKALNVAYRLQEWLDQSEGGITQGVGVEVSAYYLQIMISDCSVWNSECNDESELTVEYCKEEFRYYVDDMLKSICNEKPSDLMPGIE